MKILKSTRPLRGGRRTVKVVGALFAIATIRILTVGVFSGLSINLVQMPKASGQPLQLLPTPAPQDSTSTPSTQQESQPSEESRQQQSISTSTQKSTWKKALDGILPWASSSEIPSSPVWLDGRKIFSIGTTGQERVQSIENQLEFVVQQSHFNPETLNVYSDILNRQPAIYVKWDSQNQPLYLLTVTIQDAEIYGVAPETLAEKWKVEIRQALIKAKEERQPEFLRQQLMVSGGIILGTILVSFTLASWQQQLQQEHEQILAEISRAIEDTPPDPQGETLPLVQDSSNSQQPTEAIAVLHQQRTQQQKRNINEIQQRLLQVGQLAVWGGGVYINLGLFPYTRWLQPLILSLLPGPLKLLGTALSTYIAIRVSSVLIDSFFDALENGGLVTEAASRQALRFDTFSSVCKSLSAGICITIGILVALSIIGINLGPILAGAGIIGLGISLASQSLIKDTINGILILLEDQYAVGDVIIIGDGNIGGLVENLNLRMTQLRNSEGRLITIPNSAIAIVQNLSKEWARVDLTIDVSYQTNVDEALAVIKELAAQLYRDREWRSKILEAPEILGIDKIDHAGILIRIWIKVKPLEQWKVAREFRRRLKTKFDQVGISIGAPQQSLWLKHPVEILPDKQNISKAEETKLSESHDPLSGSD